MGIDKLTLDEHYGLDEILADLDDRRREILTKALTERKGQGTSRFFKRSATEIVRELADDGYRGLTIDEVGVWRRDHGC